MIQVGSPYNPGPKCAPRKFAKELSLGHPSRVATDEPLTGLAHGKSDARSKNVNRNLYISIFNKMYCILKI